MKNFQKSQSKSLGFDEVIIVNPGTSNRRSTLGDLGLSQAERPLFLGEDGTLYALYGTDDPLQAGDLLLGENGQFYRVASSAQSSTVESDLHSYPGNAGSLWIG